MFGPFFAMNTIEVGHIHAESSAVEMVFVSIRRCMTVAEASLPQDVVYVALWLQEMVSRASFEQVLPEKPPH